MSVNHFQENTDRKKPNTFPLVYIGVIAVFVYVVWIVGQSVYSETRNKKLLEQKQNDLDQVKLQAQIKEKFIQYQKTDNYIELQAREHFGYAKPGETIINLPEQFYRDIKQDQGLTEANKKSEKVVVSNPQLWWQYFFGKK
jgi:cell division protein FtsB